ncbi:hypothetical protein [Actinoplanes aureus]|uniref:Uncharacterized protein n=1 Tax=Actinoplanes aureus TaxID=2792083 RepID=A0A931C6Y6_9ACTN|nr:hypothetical protein [Actinoplanes aureus]MBG0562517.1 hypothetical protein [Actinoplanes aureus]
MTAHWTEVREVGESVVRTAYPAELEDFDAAAEWFRTAPRPLAHGVRPPVGMGVEFASVVPVVLSAVSLLATAVLGSVVEDTAKYLTSTTREKLAAAFRRRPAVAAPDWLTPEQEREVFRLIRERAADRLPEDEAHRLAEAVIGALRLRVADET